MVRTGVYGGTFNPIHLGHVSLAKSLVEKGYVDELWLMVSPQNPFKVNQALLDDNIRLELARLAIEGVEGVSASDYEFGLPKPSYMYHTLESLRRDFPDREFCLVIGADNWVEFHRWYNPEGILAHHRLLVYPRPGYEIGDVPEDVTVVDTPMIDISSTEIRQRIVSPDYDGEGLVPAVWERIKKEKYYTV